jgi:MraZ protein
VDEILDGRDVGDSEDQSCSVDGVGERPRQEELPPFLELARQLQVLLAERSATLDCLLDVVVRKEEVQGRLAIPGAPTDARPTAILPPSDSPRGARRSALAHGREWPRLPRCGKVEESVEYFQLAVFKGTYRYKIDPKGRLPVPAAFRRHMTAAGAEGLVVTPLDQCLAAYPPEEWARLEAQLAALPAFSRPVKTLSRLLASRAVDCALDVQGRILLPPALRQAANLTREAVLVGVLNRIEVWEPEAWAGFLRESERVLDDVSLEVQWPVPPAPPAVTGSSPSRGARPQAKPKR